MSLVPSLLQAIVRVDGEALVMHAGDKPYVVSPTGQVELANRGLTLEAVNGIVGQLLPRELQAALDEFGAVQYELPAMAEFPGEHFTVVAARGGDDVWTEIRRRRMSEDDGVPEEFFGPSANPPAARPAMATAPPLRSTIVPPPVIAQPVAPQAAQSKAPASKVAPAPKAPPPVVAIPPVVAAPAMKIVDEPKKRMIEEIISDDDLLLPDSTQLWPEKRLADNDRDGEEQEIDLDANPPEKVSASEPAPEWQRTAPSQPVAPPPVPPAVAVVPPTPAPVAVVPPPPPSPPVAPLSPPPIAMAPRQPLKTPPPQPVVAAPPPAVIAETPVAPAATTRPEPAPPSAPRAVPPLQPGVVLPILRTPIRSEQPPAPVSDQTLSALERLLRVGAARGASTLYLSSGSRPSVRVDGELQVLDAEPVHIARDVESLLLTLMPERSHEALRTGATTEWICEIEGVGRVRCMSFRDHLGPGGVFRMMPTRSVSADQLALPHQVQALAIEPEGLVLVAGSRSSGKRTLMAAFVDLMNRSRRDHIITIEREINIVHERGHSFISQREVRGDDDDMLAAARAALREDPDVIFIEDLRTGPLMNVALEAAASGRLVVGGFAAHTATGAIDRIIDLYAPEYRRQVQLALADSLRGIIVQALLRKIGGGRLPAREVLLNTAAVSSIIAEGKTSQLPMAIEGGRRNGMMPLNDALVGLVQNGSVEAREAFRHSPDRPGFLAALNRNGIDTSFVERLA